MPISQQECTEETSLHTVDAIMHGVKVISSKECILVNSLKVHSKTELPDQKFNKKKFAKFRFSFNFDPDSRG